MRSSSAALFIISNLMMKLALFSVRHRLLLYLAMSGCVWICSGAAASVGEGGLVLTNAAQVRALNAEMAARQLPVHLRGVVLMEGDVALVIADKTAGIYLQTDSELFRDFRRGDLLEVEGVSDPGKFAPVVKVTKVRKVGVEKVPDPQPVTGDELQTGRLDAQWVEVSGVVRRIVPTAQNGGAWILWLETGGKQLQVWLWKNQGAVATVDSEVRLRGVCFYQFNAARQALNPVLVLPQSEKVFVKKSPPADGYSVAPRSIGSLMQFSVEESYGHRVRVCGVVTHAEPGQGFWIQDSEHGLRVRTEQSDHLEVGASVDVLGFLSRGGYSPVLENAVFRIVGGALRVPKPERLENEAQAFDHDAELVELDATIEQQWLALDGCRLTLADSTNRWFATLPLAGGKTAPRQWRPGSRVRMAGICLVSAGPAGIAAGTIEPQSFEIMLRSTADLRVLQPPPWLTLEHIVWLLVLLVGVLLLAVGIVLSNSRRRLRAHAIVRMKSEAEFSAVWNERNRMARELHDTLAQGLGAISMNLEVVKRKMSADSEGRESLDEAQSLARSNLADARNAIWNMRSQVLETGDLATALGEILRSLTDGTMAKGEMRLRGRARRLAPLTENNLLRIGQEAVTNAVKHAGAKQIEVVLEFAERQLELTVRDDGRGFHPAHPPESEGGFGLVGIRERVEQMHGELGVTSRPGAGTVITLTLPLPD